LKVYEELTVEEKNEVERKIAIAIESTKLYSETSLTNHDKNVLENLLRENLYLLERIEK